ncbi:MAG: hypothetical protein U9R56_06695 [candidate division Zixibacteria bacterium]|nr:hypothetical protein [candidate division Zixibacteria bacterium]
MKIRIIAMSVALIFLVGSLGNNAVSRGAPEGYVSPWEIDPDDHTWGGEQRMSDNDTYSDHDSGSFLSTGILSLDIFFDQIFFRCLNIFDLQTSRSVTQDRLIQPQLQNNEDSGNRVISDSKDN